jgi:hypothetical protein
VDEPNADNRPILYLNAEDIRIDSGLLVEDVSSRSELHLSLASVGGIFLDIDDPPKVALIRTQYGYVNNADGKSIDGVTGVRLLERRLVDFSIAPYLVMAEWLRSQGDDAGARTVAIAGERLARRPNVGLRRALDSVLDWTVGYGYAPLRALVWIAGAIAVGTGVFAVMYTGQVAGMRMFDPGNQVFETDARALFNPLTYAVASVLPVGDQWVTSWRPLAPHAELTTLGFKLIGWFLASAVVVGAASRLNRR